MLCQVVCPSIVKKFRDGQEATYWSGQSRVVSTLQPGRWGPGWRICKAVGIYIQALLIEAGQTTVREALGKRTHRLAAARLGTLVALVGGKLGAALLCALVAFCVVPLLGLLLLALLPAPELLIGPLPRQAPPAGCAAMERNRCFRRSVNSGLGSFDVVLLGLEIVRCGVARSWILRCGVARPWILRGDGRPRMEASDHVQKSASSCFASRSGGQPLEQGACRAGRGRAYTVTAHRSRLSKMESVSSAPPFLKRSITTAIPLSCGPCLPLMAYTMYFFFRLLRESV